MIGDSHHAISALLGATFHIALICRYLAQIRAFTAIMGRWLCSTGGKVEAAKKWNGGCFKVVFCACGALEAKSVLPRMRRRAGARDECIFMLHCSISSINKSGSQIIYNKFKALFVIFGWSNCLHFNGLSLERVSGLEDDYSHYACSSKTWQFRD